MILEYISKIKTKASIYSAKRSFNVLDGSYISIYKGSSQNFEDLREYIPGDNVRDIDWKASSRNRNLLVRRYVAEKKHNVLVVFDTGTKMKAYTEDSIPKKDISIITGGLFSYLAAKNGDNVGAIYNNGELITFYQLKTGLYNVERILTAYDKDAEKPTAYSLDRIFDYILRNIKRRMIILVVTDANGLSRISEHNLKKATYQHDILVVNVGDAFFTQQNAFSVDKDNYVPDFIISNKLLRKREQEERGRIAYSNSKKLKGLGIMEVTIQNEDEVVEKLNDLLERHKYASNR